ncbi:4Fe-4S dicluster domain-containing protein [Methanofollis formosanus]|uniref:4Fe-4S dicluster domain-containing protein n=1 Tax=Methanofollis formosanus TaxID=299308 RepID=A0A8G1A0S3_9EURY|nr:4Fe-4S dicluster domain-containing protein [Methanofollis formosanus]QYZ78920.1 4Fe-4S dicluster domain-containing protein [Methanofollis formosanus]
MTGTKLSGILPQKEKGYVSVRVKARAGNLTTEQLAVVGAAAKEYGRGYVGATFRLNLEIPGVRREDAEAVAAALAAVGLETGSTGPTVRSVVACKGTVCRHGCADTQALARTIEEAQGGRALPRKIKIGIAGCPNNCARVQFNDIGLMARAYPTFDADACTGCGACVRICREGVVSVDEGAFVFSTERCIGCGDCIAVCPKDAISVREQGLTLFLGGRAGRRVRAGTRLAGLVPEEEAPALVGRVIDYFAEHTRQGERLGQMIDRLGQDEVFAALGLEPEGAEE